MTRHNALRLLEETLELRPQSLTGREKLAAVEGWDSLATMAFIAMADKHFGVIVPGSRVARCQTVDELLALLENVARDRAA